MSVEDIFNKAKDVVGDVKEWFQEFSQNTYKSGQQLYQAISKPKEYINLNEDDSLNIKAIKEESWLQKAKWIMWPLVKILTPKKLEWFMDKVWDTTGLFSIDDTKYKKWVNRDLFKQNYDEKKAVYNSLQEKYWNVEKEILNNPKYTTLNSFVSSIEKYKLQWISDEEATLLAQQEYSAAQLKKIQKEQDEFNTIEWQTIALKQKELQDSYKDFERYTKENIEVSEWEDITNIWWKKFEWSLLVQQKLMTTAAEEVDMRLWDQSFLKDKLADKSLSSKKDTMIELFSDLEYKRLSALSEAEPWDETRINWEYKTLNESMKKFYINQFRQELILKKNNKNTLDTDSIEKQAAINAFNSLSEEDKANVKHKKIFDNMQQMSINSRQMKNAISDWRNLNWVYNFIESTMNATGLALNLWTQSARDDVVALRVWNSIINADNITGSTFLHAMYYNPWDVLNTMLSLWVWPWISKAWWVAKKTAMKLGAEFIKEVWALNKASSAIKWSIAGQSTLFTLNQWVRAWKFAGESIVTGIAPNAAIDMAMWEISTKAQEEFNMFTDLFFDANIVWIWKAGSYTKHDILNDFIWWDSKKIRDNAVSEFTRVLNEQWITRNWKSFDTKTTKELLRDEVIPLYNTTLKPEVADGLFNKWEIYDFVKTNLEKMKKDDLKTLFTADWHIVKTSNPFTLVQKEINDLFNAGEKWLFWDLDKKTKDLYLSSFEKKIDNLNKWVTWDSLLEWSKLKNVPVDIINKFKQDLLNIKTANPKIYDDLYDSISEQISLLNEWYGSLKYRWTVSVTNALSWVELKFSLNDLDKIAQAKWKTTADLYKEWLIDLTKKEVDWLKIRKDAWTYLIKESGLSNVVKKSKQVYRDAEEYLSNTLKLPIDNVSYNAQRLSTEFKQLVTWLSQSSDGKWIVSTPSKNYIEWELDFLMQELQKIFGDNVSKMNLWNKNLTIDAIKQAVKDEDSLFVFAYGSLPEVYKKWDPLSKVEDVPLDLSEWRNIVKYLLPWKKLLDSSIGYMFESIWKESFGHYTNKTITVLRDILKNSKVIDWKIDYTDWVMKLDAIESAWKYQNVIRLDWNIDVWVVKQIVRESLFLKDNLWEWVEKVASIEKLVLDIVKLFWYESNPFIGTVIKNATHRISKNFNAVEKLILKGNKDMKMEYLKKILLDENAFQELAKKKDLLKQSEIDHTDKLITADFERIMLRNKVNRETLIETINNLKQSERNYKSTKELTDKIKQDRVIKEAQLVKVEKNLLMTEEEFRKKTDSYFYGQDIYDKINTIVDNAIMNEKQSKLSDIISYQDQLDRMHENIALKNSLSQDEFEQSVARIKIIVEVKDFQTKYDLLKELENDITVSEKIRNHIKTSISLNNSKFKDTIWVDEEKIISDIVAKMNLWTWIYEKEYTLKNNPIRVLINEMTSKKWIYDTSDNIILDWLNKHFEWTSKDVNHLFETNGKFKEFINSLYYSWNNPDEIIWAKKRWEFWKIIWKFLNDTLKDIEIKAIDWLKIVNVKDELIELAIKDFNIYESFKRIALKENNIKIKNIIKSEKQYSFKDKKTDKWVTYKKNISTSTDWIYEDRVIRIEDMKKIMWDKIWFIKISWIDVISTINVSTTDKSPLLLSKLIDDVFEKNKVYTSSWEELIALNDVQKADIIFHAIEWENASYKIWNIDVEWKIFETLEFKKILAPYRDKIRKELWLEKWEAIMWTFWDKDAYLQKYNFWDSKKSYLAKQDEYQKIYWDWLWYEWLTADVIAKRETFNMSNYNTFDNVNIPIKTYILQEVNNFTQKLKTLIKESNNLEEIKDAISWEVSKEIYEDIMSGLPKNISEVKSYLDNIFLKDFNDGTSWASKDLWRLRNEIKWLDKKDTTAFKDHFYWLKDWKIYWGKTLFNKSKSSFIIDWVEENYAVAIWEWSLKLDSQMTKYSSPKTIIINWREYKAIWEVKWTTTQDFKNASSDAHEIKEEQSVALQIINWLPLEHQEAIANIMKSQIDELYFKTIVEPIWTTDRFNSLYKNKTTQEIQDIISNYKAAQSDVGAYSDTLLWAYSNDFLWSIETLINKWPTKWETVFMQEVDPLLKNSEIILSQDNKIIKDIEDDLRLQLSKLDKDSDEYLRIREKIKHKDFEIVGYRYPVASKYNLWVYKIKLAEKLPVDSELYKKYSSIDKHSVIMSPYAVFIKKEWDFDWDHLFMVSAHSKKWNVLAKAALWEPVWLTNLELLDKLNNIRNKHITTKQVNKTKPEYNLYRARMVSLEAKKSVWLISAWIRTMRLLKNIDKNIESTIYYGKKEISTLDLRRYKFKEWDDLFDQEAASILQIALDFAKSWKSEFPSNWVRDLYNLVIDDPSGAWFKKFHDEIFVPLSTSYKANDVIDKWDISKLAFLDKFTLNKYSSWKLWIKWDLYEYFIKKYIPDIQKINITNDLWFILDNISIKKVAKEEDKVFLNKIVSKAKELLNWKRYLEKESKLDLKNFFKEESKWYKNDTLNKLVTEYNTLKESWIKWHEAISIVDKALLEDYATRNMFALYALSDWNSQIVDLLLAKEKIEFIKYSDAANRENLKTFMNKYSKDIQEQRSISDIWIINKEIEELHLILNDSEWRLDSEIDDIVNQIEIRKEEIEKIELKQSETVEDFTTKMIDSDTIRDFTEVQWEFIPRIDFSPEITRDALEETLNQHSKLATLRKWFWKLVLADILNKYNPLLMERINMVSKLTNEFASKSLWKDLKDNFVAISKLLKKEFNLRKDQAEPFMKSIDKVFTSSIKQTPDWYILTVNTDKILDEISWMNVDSVSWLPLFDWKSNKLFTDAIQKYREQIIEPSLVIINKLESTTKWSLNEITIAKEYIDTKSDTLFKDLIESVKSDYTFALRTNWLLNRTNLLDKLKTTWISNRDASILTNTLYPVRWGKTEWIFNAFNALHYLFWYWLVSTLTHQKWQIMWFVQLLPNYVQIMARIAMHKNQLSEAEAMLKKYWLLESEDLIRLSVWYDSEISQTWLMNTLSRLITIPFDKMSEFTWKDYNRFWKYVESFFMSPLTFWDAPLEWIRKRAALIEFTNTIWIEVKDLPKFIEDRIAMGWHMQDIKNFISTQTRTFYAKTWGWVVSSSQLHRKTLLNTMDIYWDEWKYVMPRIFMSAVWYLNGWWFHNTAQYVDNQLSFLRAWKYLRDWDFKWFKSEMSNWLSYNSSLLYMSNNALWLYMKTEKYERDPNDLWASEDFMKAFNNVLVSREILLWQIMESSEIANRFWDTSKAIQYTSYQLLKRYTRTLAVVPKMLAWAIDAYKHADESENIVETTMLAAKSIADSINSMNDSYMRYIWFEAMNDSYWTITDKTNIWLMWLWGNTSEDDIFEEKMKWMQFANFQNTWFMMSVSNMIVDRFKLETWEFSVTSRAVQKIIEEAYKRDWLKQLMTNKWITNIDWNQYNLWKLLWKNPDDLTDDQQKAIATLYNDVAYDYTRELDIKGRWLYKYWDLDSDETTVQRLTMLDDVVVTELKRKMELEWLDFDKVINAPSEYPKWFLKLQALAEFGWNIWAGQINAYAIYSKQSKLFKALTKELWQYDEQGKPWLTTYQQNVIKRQALMEHADFLNMDATSVHKVIELEMKYNQKDLSSQLENTYRDSKIIKEANRMLANEYLATRNLQRWDTSVWVLTTRFSTLNAWFNWNDETVWQLIIKTLIDIENSSQDPKTKLAKKAAAMLWMDKASYGLLKDDKRFEGLSYNTKKIIANWIYDTSVKSVEYDATSILKDIVNSQQTKWWYSKKYYPNRIFSNWKSAWFNDARPNFSKQFQPLKDFIPNKIWYISNTPWNYVWESMRGYPQWWAINYFKTPIMQEYQKAKIEMMMPELFWTNIIKAWWNKRELAKQRKRTIILKPKRKVKNLKRKLAPNRIPKASKWLLSDKPFNYE